MPTAHPPINLRVALGAAGPVIPPAFGAGGLFRGSFVANAPVEIVSGSVLVATSVQVGPPRHIAIEALARGTALSSVAATDSCGHRIVTEVVVEVIDAPGCRADYDPTSRDSFPLTPGSRWRHSVSRRTDAGGPFSGEEVWEVVSEGDCEFGQRLYEVSVQGTGAGVTGVMQFVVEGDYVTLVQRPWSGYGGLDLQAGWQTRRFFPASAPATILTDTSPDVFGQTW